MTRWLNIHSQETWHTDGRIVGNREGLLALRAAVDQALSVAGGRGTVDVFATDGEGYTVFVKKGIRGDRPTYLSLKEPSP